MPGSSILSTDDLSAISFDYAILLGGNIGDVQDNFRRATELLLSIPSARLLHASAVYSSPAWGFSAPDFLNQCLSIEGNIGPDKFLSVTQSIELQLGRTEKTVTPGVYSSRPIDIDILICTHKGMRRTIFRRSSRLTLPHASLRVRRFALLPLSEFWGNFKVFGKSVSDWLSLCPDDSLVTPLSPSL